MLKSVLFVLMGLWVAPSLAMQQLDHIIAVVDQNVITQSELDKEMEYVHAHLTASNQVIPVKQELQKQVLDHMINEKIELNYAKNLGLQIDDYALSQAIERIATNNKQTLDQFKAQVEKEEKDFPSFREEVRKQMLLSRLHQQLVASKVVVSKEDIAKFLDSPEGQDESGMEFLVSHILITLPDAPTPEEITHAKLHAQKVMAEINKGEDFSRIALLKSEEDSSLKETTLGWRKAAELPTIFAKDVLTMKAGEVRGPLKSASGFHIIKLKDKKSSGTNHTVTQTKVQRIVLYPNAVRPDTETEALLQKIKKEAKEGADFASLAVKYNEDNSTKDAKGSLGWIVSSQLPTNSAKAVDLLMPGEISDPVATGDSWQLLKVVDRRTIDDTKSFIQNKAKQYVFQQKYRESLLAWQRKLRDQVYVDVRIK